MVREARPSPLLSPLPILGEGTIQHGDDAPRGTARTAVERLTAAVRNANSARSRQPETASLAQDWEREDGSVRAVRCYRKVDENGWVKELGDAAWYRAG